MYRRLRNIEAGTKSKKMKASITLMVLLAGCAPNYFPPGSYSPGPPASVWMLTRFGVGKQCVKGDWQREFDLTQEKIKSRLTEAGIHLYEEETIRGGSCRACYQCAALTGNYYVRINADMEDEAVQLGFSLSEPPPKNYRN